MPKKENSSSLSALLDSLKNGRKPEGFSEKGALGSIKLRKPPPQRERITESNVEDYEKETIEAASKAIYVLEDTLSKWDALKEKPDDLVPEFERYRSFHDRLVEWAERILRSRAKGEELDFNARINRLLEYSSICKANR